MPNNLPLQNDPANNQRPALREISARVEPEALLVSPDPEDRILLQTMFQQHSWKLSTVGSLSSALEALRHKTVPLVITERDLPAANWKELLLGTWDLPQRPLFVVVSRLADEYLWAEVLNSGGYDVLAKPFCEAEALRVFANAFTDGRQLKSTELPAYAASGDTASGDLRPRPVTSSRRQLQSTH